MNRVEWTVLFADAAGNTSDITVFLDLRPFLLIVAIDNDLLTIRYISNHRFRAGLHTFATSSTLFWIHQRQPVRGHMDRVKRTHPFTGAQTQTAKGAGFSAAGNHSRSAAIRNPLIFKIGSALVISAFTDHIGHFFNPDLRIDAHNFRQRCCTVRAPYRAAIDRRLARCNSTCKLIAARKAATTTVGTRERFTDHNRFRVHFNGKFLRSERQGGTKSEAHNP